MMDTPTVKQRNQERILLAAQGALVLIALAGIATACVQYGGQTRDEHVIRWLSVVMAIAVILPMAGMNAYRLVSRRWKRLAVPAAIVAVLSFMPGVFMMQQVVASLAEELARAEVSMKGWSEGASRASKIMQSEGRVMTRDELRPYAEAAMHEAASRNGLSTEEERAVLGLYLSGTPAR